MKVVKILYRSVTVLLLIATVACMFVNYSTERQSGGYTGVNSIISADSKQWIVDTFSEYETFDELLFNGMTSFVLDNFVYDSNYDYKYPLQAFSFDRFRNANWRGVCFHFAQWAKSVVLEWSRQKGVGVQCYVFDVVIKKGGKHSYNFFVYDGNTYCVDFTEALARFNKDLPYNNSIKNIGNISMWDYAENYYEDKVFNVY